VTRRIAVIGAALGHCLGSMSAQAQPLPTPFVSIAPQPLAQALATFAKQTGLQIVYVSGSIAGATSKGAPTGLSPAETLSRLLDGTGLTFEFLNQRTVRIFRGKAVPQVTMSPGGGAGQSPEGTTTAAARPDAASNNAIDERKEGNPMTSTTKHLGFLGRISGLLALCGPLLSVNPAYCQQVQATQPTQPDQLQEIIVTAQKREQSLQDVPISVTAVDGDTISGEGFVDIQELSKFVPNLFMRNNLTGQQMVIRGIGTGVDNEGFEQAVSQFVDGVYYGRATLDQNQVFDVDHVEAVRGPQPTFAGQSSTAGAVSTFNRRPGKTWEGDTNVSYGKFGELSLDGGIGGPITDTLGVRLSGRYYTLPDTDYHNWNGAAVGTKKDQAARLIATWSPATSVDVTFKAEHQNILNNGEGGGPSQCDTNPATSVSNGFLFPGFPAACALDVKVLGLDLNNRYEAYQGGLLDARAALDWLNAKSGGTPANPVWGTTGVSVIPYGLNLVHEFNQPEDRQYIFDVFMGNVVWRFGDLSLNSTTAYMHYNKHYILDPDYSAFALFSDHRAETFSQFSQEFRLSSPADQTVSWMVGGYFQRHRLDTSIDIYGPWTFGAPFLPANAVAASFGGTLYESSTWLSAFAAATWHVTDKFRLNAGGRYQNVGKDGFLPPSYAYLTSGATGFGPQQPYPNTAPATGAERDSRADPELSVQWDIVDGVMAYAKYASAFKAGGFVMSPIFFGGLPNPFTYKPEYAKGYEAGVKTTLLNHRLEVNADYYYTKYTDQQVSVYNSPTNSFITANAGESHTQGLEFDGRWLVTRGLTIRFDGTVGAEAKYDKFEGASCNQLEAATEPAVCAKGVSRDGVSLPFSSNWSIGINPEYQFPISSSLVGKVNLNFIRDSGYNIEDDQDPRNHQPAYDRIDARMSFGPESGAWELGLYGRNLSNERILLQNYTNFDSQSLTPPAAGATYYGPWGPNLDRGITFGVQFSARFGGKI
jgi:outer membrane receptor protein involved in Fe transport